MEKNVLVIQEFDLEDKDFTVIGVADSVENAEKLINEYYGEFEEISHRKIEDSNLEYSKVLNIHGASNITYKVKVFLEWFNINACA